MRGIGSKTLFSETGLTRAKQPGIQGWEVERVPWAPRLLKNRVTPESHSVGGPHSLRRRMSVPKPTASLEVPWQRWKSISPAHRSPSDAEQVQGFHRKPWGVHGALASIRYWVSLWWARLCWLPCYPIGNSRIHTVKPHVGERGVVAVSVT